MAGSYRYYEGTDGRRYCWSLVPSFRCPVGAVEHSTIGAYVLTPAIEQAAQALDVDPQYLARSVKHSAERARVGGKLTEDCNACGHRLERLGFAYWIAAKQTPGDSSVSIAIRLGVHGRSGFVMVEGGWYAKTKNDAKAWAWGRVKLLREAA